MPITVKYFASLRERLGREQDTLPEGQARTVAEVWDQVTGGEAFPANTLAARNLEYVDPDTPVRDGDEVAFFPPVTGG